MKGNNVKCNYKLKAVPNKKGMRARKLNQVRWWKTKKLPLFIFWPYHIACCVHVHGRESTFFSSPWSPPMFDNFSAWETFPCLINISWQIARHHKSTQQRFLKAKEKCNLKFNRISHNLWKCFRWGKFKALVIPFINLKSRMEIFGEKLSPVKLVAIKIKCDNSTPTKHRAVKIDNRKLSHFTFVAN